MGTYVAADVATNQVAVSLAQCDHQGAGGVGLHRDDGLELLAEGPEYCDGPQGGRLRHDEASPAGADQVWSLSSL